MHFTCFPELRIQVSPQRFRVPGLCLIARGTPREQIVRTPPLLCIEVLSPEDTMKRTLLRVADFLAMGVPEVWVVDPVSRTIQVCVGSTMTEHPTGDLAVPNTSIALSIDRVFSVLDES
jgi:Uma2 family endonuclease